MNYNEYIAIIRKELQIKMGPDFIVTISPIKKNNGVAYQGISITDKTSNLSPVFYLDGQYEADKNSCTEIRIRETVGDIIRLYYEQGSNASIDLGLFKSYEKIKSKVLFRLINFQKNEESLVEIPHKRFYDLALVFYYDIKNENFKNGSILLNNSHLKSWGVSLEEIFADALLNTPKLRPAITQTMAEVMKEMLEIRVYEKYGDGTETKALVKKLIEKDLGHIDEIKMKQDNQRYKMYVAGNQQKYYGAAVLLYPDFIKNFAGQIKSDLYIFPSSVHEIIISPAEKNHDRAELLKMVCEINATQVDPEEVLADTVYFYNRPLDVLELIV
ncbi:MAG: DUF5688 family protein [Lachnospiraceae bacterium]|nr:DUF5688 family protein [Lachnospiraceae bacterium]